MKLDAKKRYIELQSKFLYNKYFYKLLLETKYLENFGDIELSKMKNIYETMIINKKIEDTFSLANDNSIQYYNLVEYRARKEFFDLDRQIKDLEKNINNNSKKLKELKFYLNKGIGSSIKNIVEKTSPYINSTKKSRALWLEFTHALNDENWKKVIQISDSISKLRVYDSKLGDTVFEEKIKEVESSLIALKNRFPFTKSDILEDEKSIEQLKNKENKDVKTMKRSYEKMTDIYLSTSATPEWYS